MPLVFSFREPEGMRRLFKKKQDVTLRVLKPLYGDEGILEERARIEDLKNKAHEAMEDAVLINRECEEYC